MDGDHETGGTKVSGTMHTATFAAGGDELMAKMTHRIRPCTRSGLPVFCYMADQGIYKAHAKHGTCED